MFTSTTSSHSTPRGSQAERVPLPPFVVTSGNETPYGHTSTSAKPTSSASAALNPEAREFRVSPSFGGSLFAMPATTSATHTRWVPPSAPRDFPCRPASVRHAAASASPSQASAFEMPEGMRLVEMTEAYLRERYAHKCREEGLHMVSVFNLQPRTTTEQLSSMFFPTGACAAESLEPRHLPEPLASAFAAVRQRAGAVFFTRRDFAMVGVEKIHDFVPHGQHQPLVVRYCGPEAAVNTPLSVASAAASVSSPPNTRPTPAPASHRDPAGRLHTNVNTTTNTATTTTTTTATVLPPLPALDTLAINDAAAALSSTSDTYDTIDQHFLQKYAGDDVYLVGVHNLAYGTSAKSLFKVFYPMGALNSELLSRPVSVEGKLRFSGVAIFGSKGMAMEAAEKMNDFVPHGQRRPLVTRFIERNASAATDAARPQAQQQQQPPTAMATASTPRAKPPLSATTTAATTSAAALLQSIERQLRAKALSDAQLAADVCALVLCSDSAEAEAKQLAEILRTTLQSTGDHSTVLSSPLSNAFRTVHTTLGLRTRTSPPDPADASPLVRKATMFLQQIGRTFMMLVVEADAARQTRIVAAVQCAYLYQYTYLPRTPLSFATALFQTFSRELSEAKAFLGREADVPSSVKEEKDYLPWLTLMDALQEMVLVWRSLDPRAYALDAAHDDYERFVRDFRGADAPSFTKSPRSVLNRPAEPLAEACTPRNDALDVCAEGGNMTATTTHSGHSNSSGNGASRSAKKSLPATPSARPTPRRVVSKSFSTTSDWKGKQSTPVMHASGAVPPQVMLSSPASDYTQGASEFSADSTTGGGPFGSALRHVGSTPQHPSMRFAWGTRATGGPLPPSPAATSAAAAVAVALPPQQPPTTALASSEERSDAAMTECTVYITKLPSCFTAAQVRRLLLLFGEFRKVRLCHDDKETTRCGSAEAVAAHQLKFHDLCFGFVEFSEPASARAMVEFFRNEVHSPAAFDRLRAPESAVDIPNATAAAVVFDEAELAMLRSTRTSQARNPIHDQLPTDATHTTPCFFGLVRPTHTIETYAEVVTAEEVAAAWTARTLQQQQQQQQQPTQQVPASLLAASFFATASPFTVTAAPAVSEAAHGALAPLEDVHFPHGFPYRHVFAGACDDDDDDDAECTAPVLVEDDDDDDDGMQEYQVEQLLQLIR